MFSALHVLWSFVTELALWFGWLAIVVIGVGIIIWVLTSGFLITNLSIELDQQRSPTPDSSKHDLVTAIKVAKGRLSPAVTLLSLKTEVFSFDRDLFERRIVGEPPETDYWIPDPSNRSLNAVGVACRERHVLAIWTAESGRALNLVPTERAQYASYCVIPSDMVCETLVTLTGRRYKAQFAKQLLVRMYTWIISKWPTTQSRLEPLRTFGFVFRPWIRPEKVYWTASIISVKEDVIPVAHPPQEGGRGKKKSPAKTAGLTSHSQGAKFSDESR